MRFAVVRRSTKYDEGIKPCKEAFAGTLPRWDYRTSKSPGEFDEKVGYRTGLWFDAGTDHGYIYGPRGGVRGIKRRMGDEPAWFVELPDLAALVAFFDKYGDIVITHADSDQRTPCLEIYDDYRE